MNHTGYYDTERPDPRDYKLKKGKFSKIMVVAIAIALLAFTAATFWVALSGSYVPDALIYCFFGAALGEFWALAVVKKSKTEKEEQDVFYRNDRSPADNEYKEADEGNPSEACSSDEEQQARLRV